MGSANQSAVCTPGYLYRHWSETGELLYVGISVNAVARLAQHRGKAWFPQIAKITVQRFDDYGDAERAELVAICDENPLHNAKGPRNRAQLRNALGRLKTAQKRASARNVVRASKARRMFDMDRMFGCIPDNLSFEEYAANPKRWQR